MRPGGVSGSRAPVHPLFFGVRDLERDASGAVYDKTQIEAATCDGVPLPMGEDAGAGQFYSKSNVKLEENAYVPDAEGYPFSITRYTPDNTGRILRQGGVGDQLQVGRHDTRYYYGRPGRWELERLFGVNVGNASHYEKRLIVDPNGQASVSYLDAKGRTVAHGACG